MRMHMGAEGSVARGSSLNTLCFCSRTGAGAEQRCYLVINSAALLEALSTMITLKKLTRYLCPQLNGFRSLGLSWLVYNYSMASNIAALLFGN